MNRKRFFASLLGVLGIAKAQQWNQCVPDEHVVRQSASGSAMAVCSDKMKPALNGQCPVCGTMANKRTHSPSAPPKESVELLIRCTRCNAAFWKDDESAKKP